MAAKTELEFREALLTTGQLQPVRVDSKGGRLISINRLLKGVSERVWLQSVAQLLHSGEELDVPFVLGRQYILKDGAMVAGYRVEIDAKSAADLKRCVDIFKILAQQIAEMTPEPDPEPEPVKAPTPATVPEAEDPEEAAVEVDAKKLSPEEVAARRIEYRKHTTSAPRAMEVGGPDPVVPANYDPSLKVVFQGKAKDQKGRMVPVVFHEFPLPHIYGVDDMNVPNEKGRGAKTLG